MSIEYFDHNKGIEIMTNLLVEDKLTPIIGSGFTGGCHTSTSTVPNGIQIAEIMKEEIKSLRKELNLDNCDLPKISERYFEVVPKEQRNRTLKKYFTNVVLTNELKDFIDLPWRYIYTLNVDDAIEHSSEYKPVIPYIDAYPPEQSDKLVYKLHGDVTHELTYNIDNNLVFSFTQYINTLVDPNNSTMINAIRSDYKQKNLIFIGCSLKDEPDIKFIYNSVKSEIPRGTLRTVIRKNKPSFDEEMDLESYGINSVILVNDYRTFYMEFVSLVNKQKALEDHLHFAYKNPQFIKNSSDKERIFKFFSGKNIFLERKNAFFKSDMQVKRSIVNEIVDALKKHNAVIIQGRRFSGKTHILSNVIEQFKKYNVFYFPSNILFDELLISSMLKEEQNALFLFDSNSLSDYAYKEVAYSLDSLRNNDNKVIITVNTKDVFISDTLEAKVIHVNPRFDKAELSALNNTVDNYSLIRRKPNDTNMDYLKRISDEQKFTIGIFAKYPKTYTISEKMLLLLLCVNDKLYLSDIVALDISFKEVDDLIYKLSEVIEKINVSKGENSRHSTEKLVHNSTYVMLGIMEMFSNDEIINTIVCIVQKLIRDSTRKRLCVKVVLFDTLNQLFGKKNGAGNLIYKIYCTLEEFLSSDMDYWLQRAKCVYRLKSRDKEELMCAYRYAKKAYIDGDMRNHVKSALSLSLISCLISEVDLGYTSNQYELDAIDYAYEAITSDYFKKIGSVRLNDELDIKIRNGESYYKKLMKICHKHKETADNNSTFHKIIEIEKKLLDVKKENVTT